MKVSPGNPSIYQQLQAWKKEAELHNTFTATPTARFTVMFEGPEQQAIASRVSATLESAYLRVGRAINSYPPQTVTAILYTKEQFRDITKSPSWAAAAYDGRIRIPVLGALNNPAELDRIVTHEFTHAVIQQLYPGIPFWMNEGLATYMEPVDHSALMARLRGTDGTIALDGLNEAFRTSDGGDAATAYARAYAVVKTMAERLGANFPVFLQYVSNGTRVEDALSLFNVTSLSIPVRRQKH